MSDPSQPPRIRPARVALAVCGVLALVGVGTGAVLFGPHALESSVEAFERSRPAEAPALPSTDPVAAAAQDRLEAAGGAEWSGALLLSGREIDTYEGVLDLSGECGATMEQSYPGDGGPVLRTEFVSVGTEAAAQTRGSGPWRAGHRHFASLTPIYFGAFSAGSPCTVVEDLVRTTDGLVPDVDVPNLPAAAPGVERYSAPMTLERVDALQRYNNYRVLADEAGHAPSRGEFEDSIASMRNLLDREPRVVLDVDSAGAPVALWVVAAGKEGGMVTWMDFERFGSQEVTMPPADSIMTDEFWTDPTLGE